MQKIKDHQRFFFTPFIPPFWPVTLYWPSFLLLTWAWLLTWGFPSRSGRPPGPVGLLLGDGLRTCSGRFCVCANASGSLVNGAPVPVKNGNDGPGVPLTFPRELVPESRVSRSLNVDCISRPFSLVRSPAAGVVSLTA